MPCWTNVALENVSKYIGGAILMAHGNVATINDMVLDPQCVVVHVPQGEPIKLSLASPITCDEHDLLVAQLDDSHISVTIFPVDHPKKPAHAAA